MTTNWQYSESFADTNLKMLENEALCDVTFAAGNEKKQIKCHKFILASRSPVFYAMFCGALAETKDVICVPDIEPSTLENVLRYLYSGKIEIIADTALSLLYAAKKYDIPGLESQCKSFINDNIDAENVCTILDQAIIFDDEDMKAKTLDIIMDQSERVLKSDAFVQMSNSGLQEVLKLETFSASECELYISCKRWAAQRCRAAKKQETDEYIRQELGDELIGLIRFPTMTLEEFTNIVVSENVLNKDEMVSVYRSIGKQENASHFNCKPRVMVTECLFVRCERVCSGWGYNGKQDGLSFTVSQNCQLSAVDMFLPTNEGSVTGVVELLEGTTVIHSQNVTLHHNKGVEHLLVRLDNNLRLYSSNEYSIRQRMTGSSRVFYCGSAKPIIRSGRLTMTLSDLKVGVSEIGTNVSTGQFYGFEIVIKTKK